MKNFISVFFILLLVFSSQLKGVSASNSEEDHPVERNANLPDYLVFDRGLLVGIDSNLILSSLWDKIKNAVGMVAIPGFGENFLATGYFISDKLFVTDFLPVSRLTKDSNWNITIWIKDKYFPVKKIKSVYGTHRLAVLEIESSYKGGVLTLKQGEVLTKEGALTKAVYGAGFDMEAILFSDIRYHITADRIFRGSLIKRNDRISTDKYLSLLRVIGSQSISGYYFFQLNRDGMHSSTNGLPFFDHRGEVIGMKFQNTANLAYATPVTVLTEVLNGGKGNCDQFSIQECLRRAKNILYGQAENKDPAAQYAYSQLYSMDLHADRWTMSSAIVMGNILSQLQLARRLSSRYNCFDLPNKNNRLLDFTGINYIAQLINSILKDKNMIVEDVVELLHKMQGEQFILADYLKGLMFLNGNCVEKDIEKGLALMEKVGEANFFPALSILISNYSWQKSLVFNRGKADYFFRGIRLYNIKHRNPFFNIDYIDQELIIQ